MEWLQTMRFYAKKFVLKESSVRTWKNAYIRQVLWAEQFWNGHPQKLDHESLQIALPQKLDPSKISRYTV